MFQDPGNLIGASVSLWTASQVDPDEKPLMKLMLGPNPVSCNSSTDTKAIKTCSLHAILRESAESPSYSVFAYSSNIILYCSSAVVCFDVFLVTLHASIVPTYRKTPTHRYAQTYAPTSLWLHIYTYTHASTCRYSNLYRQFFAIL